MKTLILLKETTGNEPFKYYVFVEPNLEDNIAELYINDTKRYDKVAEMNDYLRGEAIEIQFIYAFGLNIIFFTLLFGGVMPLLWIFGFFSVVFLYFIQKIIFVRHHRKQCNTSCSFHSV